MEGWKRRKTGSGRIAVASGESESGKTRSGRMEDWKGGRGGRREDGKRESSSGQ